MVRSLEKILVILLSVSMLIISSTLCATYASETEDSDSSELVVDAYSDEKSDEYGSYEYHIPQIAKDGAGIAAVNATICEDLSKYVPITEGEDESEELSEIMSITYNWYVNDDVLSICVDVASAMNDLHDYFVYNVSLSEGERISDAQLFRAGGMDRDGFYDNLRTALENFWNESFGNFEGDGEFEKEQRERTLSDDNICLAKPFIGQDGEVCAVVRVYPLAGAENYWNVIPLA